MLVYWQWLTKVCVCVVIRISFFFSYLNCIYNFKPNFIHWYASIVELSTKEQKKSWGTCFGYKRKGFLFAVVALFWRTILVVFYVLYSNNCISTCVCFGSTYFSLNYTFDILNTAYIFTMFDLNELGQTLIRESMYSNTVLCQFYPSLILRFKFQCTKWILQWIGVRTRDNEMHTNNIYSSLYLLHVP